MGPERTRPRSSRSLAAGEETGAIGVERGGSDRSVALLSGVQHRQTPLSAAGVVRGGSTVRDEYASDPGSNPEARLGAAARVGRVHTPTTPPAERSSAGPDGTEAQPTAPGLLPCLSSNNSIGEGSSAALRAALSMKQQHKKSACALAWNVQYLAEQFGLERLGFLTLTFADHVLDPHEAQRRFNSLNTNILASRYEARVRVFERQKSGRIHYHLLVVLPFDARTGVDFAQLGDGNWKTASQDLRNEWAYWRKTAKLYGFGRTELMPIRSTEEGIGRYVGKYIGKHHSCRKEEDRGVRLVQYSTKARMARTRFGWCTGGAAEWRSKVRIFAQIVSEKSGQPVNDISDLAKRLGPHWAHHYRELIAGLPVCTAGSGYAYTPAGDLYRLSDGEVIQRAAFRFPDPFLASPGPVPFIGQHNQG